MAITTVNPATGAPIATYRETSAAHLEIILDSARHASEVWRDVSFEERADTLRSIAAALRAASEAFASTIAAEMGKPIAQGEAEIEKCAWACEFYADNGASFLAPTPVETDATDTYVQYPPLGVLLAIMPWNYPVWQVIRAVSPALMAGNVIVLKHASNVTGTALMIESVLAAATSHNSLLQVVVLPGKTAETLIADSRIDAVTLTGSEAVGSRIGALCGEHLKKAVLELGGSDPYIVLADADVERAAEVAVQARFQNAGQSCIAAKRFIVVEAVAEQFEKAFAARAAELTTGDPTDPAVDMGPMARTDLRDELADQVQRTLDAGGRLVCGGERPTGDGAFYPPTVVADVAVGTPMFDEETFGPAAAIITARDEDHAIALANQTPYGLSSSIWTSDIDRARQIASRIQAGAVFVNAMTASDPRMPFGGIKRSGYGRELGPFGIREFVNVQGVTIA
jgi:acyl-CoA reductase-like NAD-dependent aldehyde dehydrogenase